VRTSGGRIAALLIGIATAIVIVAVSIVPFLTPSWVAFEQDRSQAAAWTGFSTADLRTATNAILNDLVVGPPDFDVEVDGRPVLNEREQAHMRDVRTVFAGLYVLAAVSAFGLVVASRRRDRAGTWRAVRGGAVGLSVGVVVFGVIGVVAFDQLFEVFHEVFFPAGSYLFDPANDRLVQLFPFEFWQETALVVGGVIIAISLGVAWFAGRRATRQVAVGAPEPDLSPIVEPGS
jgi:integral membrane protein (TIGR01906 family)